MAKVLRIEIEQAWHASDFQGVFDAVSELYDICAVLEIWSSGEPIGDYDYFEFEPELLWLLARRGPRKGRMPRFFSPAEIVESPNRQLLLESERFQELYKPLLVKKIQFASPGLINLKGLGEPIKHLCKFGEFLIRHFSERNLRAAKVDGEKLRNDRLRMQNTRYLLDTAARHRLPPSEILRLGQRIENKQNKMIELIESGQITDIGINENESDE
jgi:hypothetical protein